VGFDNSECKQCAPPTKWHQREMASTIRVTVQRGFIELKEEAGASRRSRSAGQDASTTTHVDEEERTTAAAAEIAHLQRLTEAFAAPTWQTAAALKQCSAEASKQAAGQLQQDEEEVAVASSGPSMETLKELQRKLQEATGMSSVGLKSVTSSSSVSTMAPPELDSDDFCGVKPRMGGMHSRISSYCSMSGLDENIDQDEDACQELEHDLQSRASGWKGYGVQESPTEGPEEAMMMMAQSSHEGHMHSTMSGAGFTSSNAALKKKFKHGSVPKNTNFLEEYTQADRAATATTMMIRNIPNRYTQSDLIHELKGQGFKGTFDFLYLPIDSGTMSNVGYAFVNFVHASHAQRCMHVFDKYQFKKYPKTSGKLAAVSVAHIQGLEANVKHYERAAVNMTKSQQHRPIFIANIASSLNSSSLSSY